LSLSTASAGDSAAGEVLPLNSHTVPSDLTLRGHQGRLRLPPQAARTGRSAKNADAPLNQSREAHRSARPLHSPEEADQR
jgi:hypothetical protein